MVDKKNTVDELKSFYFQNVISHLYVVTTTLSAIVLGLIDPEYYLIILISSIIPHLYEAGARNLKNAKPNIYYMIGLALNSAVFSVFLYSISFEPTITGLLVLMYTYTLISYGGWKLWFLLFPMLLTKSFLLFYIFGAKDVIHAPLEMVASAVVTSCCFIVVTANYRYESKGELEKSKTELKALFDKQTLLSGRLSRYLSPKVVESLVSGDDSIETHQRKEVVVFFSDLCNFTSLSEEMSPEDMSKVLNQYLSKMSDIANKYDATIDKFIGDAVMVFFGAPHSHSPKEDALKCVRMADAMKKEMQQLNDKWKSEGIQHEFKVRMGIHQGWATVGNFGAENQVNYTVIGTAVNIASRLEQQCPIDKILVSRKIMEMCKDQFKFSFLDKLELKGIENAMEAYIVEDKHSHGSKTASLLIEANENTIDDIRWKLKKIGVSAKTIN
jgi:adenylate cyclase